MSDEQARRDQANGIRPPTAAEADTPDRTGALVDVEPFGEPLPGVRVGQVWQQRIPKQGRVPLTAEVTSLGLGDVYCTVRNGHATWSQSLPRGDWEDRWVLVSEGGDDAEK